MIALVAALLLAAGAQDSHANHGHAGPGESPGAPGAADIVVTINPEARVSAVKHRSSFQLPCGASAAMRVQVVNQGFVTAPLEARVVGSGAAHVAVDSSLERLTGRAAEMRELRVRPIGSLPADVTIAFSISQEIGDLNGRDRVHLLVTCK